MKVLIMLNKINFIKVINNSNSTEYVLINVDKFDGDSDNNITISNEVLRKVSNNFSINDTIGNPIEKEESENTNTEFHGCDTYEYEIEFDESVEKEEVVDFVNKLKLTDLVSQSELDFIDEEYIRQYEYELEKMKEYFQNI